MKVKLLLIHNFTGSKAGFIPKFVQPCTVFVRINRFKML